MRSKLLYQETEKTFALVFDEGDLFMENLLSFAKQEGLTAAHFTALGAFSDLKLGYFVPQEKWYRPIEINEQVEVIALVGDIALYEGEPFIHAHAVVGKADGTAHGGHLVEGHVRPTLEVVLTESPRHLQRQYNPEVGLPLISL